MPACTPFVRTTLANATVIFALGLLPVAGVVGAAVDYAHVVAVRAELVDALDASLRAVGSRPPMADAEAFATVRADVDDRLGPHYAGEWTLDSLTQSGDRIAASASGSVGTTIARVIGIARVPITVEGTAIRRP